jgi:hypothetical protein
MTPMKKLRAAIAVVGTLLLAVCTDAAAAADASAQERSDRIREKLNALLAPRRRSEPLPLDPPNPFMMQAPVSLNRTPAPAGAERPATPAAPDPAATLARFASELKISGMIRLNEQVQIIINENAWKEGDFITIERGGRVVRLQVARIQPGQLTLRLDEAELVIRF